MKRRYFAAIILILILFAVFIGFYFAEKSVSLTGQVTLDSSELNVSILPEDFTYDENLSLGCFISGGEILSSGEIIVQAPGESYSSNYRYNWYKNDEKYFFEDEFVREVSPFVNSVEGNVKTAVSDDGSIFFLYDTYAGSLDNTSELNYLYIDSENQWRRVATFSFPGNQTDNVFKVVGERVFMATRSWFGEEEIVVQSSDFLFDEQSTVSPNEMYMTKMTGIEVDSNSNIYIFGENESQGERDLMISKIDSDGNFSWNFVYGNNSGYNETAYDVEFGSSGEIFVLGGASNETEDARAIFLAVNSAGQEIYPNVLGLEVMGKGELEMSSSGLLYSFYEESGTKTLVIFDPSDESYFGVPIFNQIDLNFSSSAGYILKDFVINDYDVLQAVFSVEDSGEKSSLYMEMDLSGNITYYSINNGYDLGVSEVVIDDGKIVSSLKWNDSENVYLMPTVYYDYFSSEDGIPFKFSNITYEDVSVNDNLTCEAYAFNVTGDIRTEVFSDSVTITQPEIVPEEPEDTGGSGGSSGGGGGSVVSPTPVEPEEPEEPILQEPGVNENPPLQTGELEDDFSSSNIVSISEVNQEDEVEYSFGDLIQNVFDRFIYAKQISRCEASGNVWNNKLDICIKPEIKLTASVYSAINSVVKTLDLTRNDFFLVDSVLVYRCEGCFQVSGLLNSARKTFRLSSMNIEELQGCVPISCSDEGRECGEISDGCGEILNCGECSSFETCFSGSCILSNLSYCEDSDSGEAYNVKGVVRDSNSVNEDYCSESKTLIEGICKDYEYDFVEYECSGACVDGACDSNCLDSDFENDIFERGVVEFNNNIYYDECSSGSVVQYSCGQGQVTQSSSECVFGCENGSCILGSCLDNDGNSSNTKSYVIDNSGRTDDYCSNDITLVEGLCVENAFGQGKEYSSEMIFCPNGCSNGKCVPSGENCIDDDGMNFYNQGTIDFKDPNGIMRSRKDTCTNTTAYIGLSNGPGKYVNEFDCPPEKQNIMPYYGGTIYECPNGCLDGRCLPPAEEVSYCEGGYCKLYEGESLIFDAYLSLSTNYIYTNEFLIIGYDYNYTYPQRVELNFLLGNGYNLDSGELNEEEVYSHDFSGNDYYEMDVEILNIVGVRDSERVYDTVSKPYVEFNYDILGYSGEPSIVREVDSVVLQPTLAQTYEDPTFFDNAIRFFTGEKADDNGYDQITNYKL